jgi:hypothetical protein
MDDERTPGRAPRDAQPSGLELPDLGEAIVDEVPGLGATLVLTATRVVVVRQGAHFRPRNGVRAWPFAAFRDIQIESPRHGSGRIILRVGRYSWQAISIFIGAPEWAAAERVVLKIRVRVAEARRLATRSKRSDGTTPAADPPEHH